MGLRRLTSEKKKNKLKNKKDMLNNLKKASSLEDLKVIIEDILLKLT